MASKDLSHGKAVDKLQAMAAGIDFAMLITDMDSRPFHAIPMSTKKVDDQGLIWFLSGKDSTHNANIARDNKVELVYAKPSAMEFLTVYGEASITTDPSVLEDLYGKADDAWFDGVKDPNLTAISIRPIEAFYWDPTSNKLVTLVKMGVQAVTGSQPDLMDQGRLNV